MEHYYSTGVVLLAAVLSFWVGVVVGMELL